MQLAERNHSEDPLNFPSESLTASFKSAIDFCYLSSIQAAFSPDRPEIPLYSEVVRDSILLAAKLQNYNAVYFFSRAEAVSWRKFAEDNESTINSCGELLAQDAIGTAIVNGMVQRYISLHEESPGKKVVSDQKALSAYCFQAQDGNTLRINAKKFFSDKTAQLYDLHDFVHILTATSSNGAFGVKYQNGLQLLPQRYKDLTYSAGMKDATGLLFSDGILLSHLSLPIFNALYESGEHSNEEMQEIIAQALFEYMIGSISLLHPPTDKDIAVDQAPDALDLAVLVQNKRYERRGAEFERYLFTRGTPQGPRGDPQKDPLYGLSASEKVIYLASNPTKVLYFEQRNLIRNRAQERAYQLYAQHLLQTGQGPQDLIYKILEFISLDDLRNGRETNLYEEVAKYV